MKIDPKYSTMRESDPKVIGLDLEKRGKVRDVYGVDHEKLLFVTTDRISTHDVVYDQCIPHKGFGLTKTTADAFLRTNDIVDDHYIDSPDPNCMLVRRTETYPIEVVVRGILTGSAWREYQKNGEVCGIRLPKGMRKNQQLDQPIVTPATKAETGHDVNITHYQAKEIVGNVWDKMEKVAIKLYERGDSIASHNGAMLADTKFEFGRIVSGVYKGIGTGSLMLIDEELTHDSSRYLMRDDWEASLREGREPDWIDKQLVRNYAESQGFSGEGDPPTLPDDIVTGAAERVLKVYSLLFGTELQPPKEPPTSERIANNLKREGIL